MLPGLLIETSSGSPDDSVSLLAVLPSMQYVHYVPDSGRPDRSLSQLPLSVPGRYGQAR